MTRNCAGQRFQLIDITFDFRFHYIYILTGENICVLHRVNGLFLPVGSLNSYR